MPKNPLSIHVIGSRLFGGADHFYVRLLQALHEAGQPVAAVNRSGSPIAEALVGSGIKQTHLPFANGWDMWSRWQMRRIVSAQQQPCIVQTYMGRATRLTHVPPKLGHVHIARLGGYYKIDGYYRHANAWIGNTQGLCDYLVGNGLPAERVFRIGNFVPDPLDVPADTIETLRRDWAIPADALVLFTLGRLVDIKGFDDLLHAFSRLPTEIGGRPLLLLIAGNGPLQAELHALSANLKLERRVRWLGWQDPADAFFKLADVFVCPSREEALGNVILEAWNHGVAVVSTTTPGGLELVEEGRTGLLCPIAEPAALASRLSEALNATPAEREAMGSAGQQYLNANFSKPAIVDAYLNLYQQLLASRH